MSGSVIAEAAAYFVSAVGEALPAVLGVAIGGFTVALIIRAINGSMR